MNALNKNQMFNIEQSGLFCKTHSEAMVRICGRDVCKTCAAERVAQSQAKHDKELQAQVHAKRVAAATIPVRHADCGFKNYSTNLDEQRTARDQCRKLADDFIKGELRNLIMTGRTGTGKTHLACAIARNILHKGKFAKYTTSEDMASQIANAWTKTDDSEAAAIYRFTEHDLLIIDEYGLHDQHENRLKLVHKVLYARYDAKKPTVLISNFTTEQLKSNLGDRLWSRFQHDGLTVVECNWTDARVRA